MTIDNDVKITINLTDLVNIRCDVLDLDEDDLDSCDRERIVNNLRTTSVSYTHLTLPTKA